jgi:hypothetical protein
MVKSTSPSTFSGPGQAITDTFAVTNATLPLPIMRGVLSQAGNGREGAPAARSRTRVPWTAHPGTTGTTGTARAPRVPG